VKTPALDHWLPAHPLRWAAGFAALYAAFFMINVLLSPLLDILSDRIALIFFPAFIRVMALVVAGLAGALGIVLGSLIIQLFYVGADLWASLPVSLASGIGAWAAYAVMRFAFDTKQLPITLPVLLALSGLYSAFNAMIHGLVWHVGGVGAEITAEQLSLMMLGDFLGVVVMFGLTRWLLRSWLVLKSP
jgi:hypothetical protein